MSATFLSNFMRIALQKTSAERGLACDLEMGIMDMVNMEQSDVLSTRFTGMDNMRKALATGEAIITNNAVMDPALAPVTNTNFSNLRVVVVIPLADYGAVYVDQPIRRGIIAREIVNRLMLLANYVMENSLIESSTDQLDALYEEIQ